MNENSENENKQHQDSNQSHTSLVSDAKDESQNDQKIIEEVKTKKENQNLPSNQVECCSVLDIFGVDENEEFRFVEEKKSNSTKN